MSNYSNNRIIEGNSGRGEYSSTSNNNVRPYTYSIPTLVDHSASPTHNSGVVPRAALVPPVSPTTLPTAPTIPTVTNSSATNSGISDNLPIIGMLAVGASLLVPSRKKGRK